MIQKNVILTVGSTQTLDLSLKSGHGVGNRGGIDCSASVQLNSSQIRLDRGLAPPSANYP